MVKLYIMCCVIYRQKALLVQSSPGHPDAGLWAPPGGHLINSERPQQTAVREVKEETDLDVSIQKLIKVAYCTTPSHQEFLVIVYQAKPSQKSFQIKLDGEAISKYTWAGASDIAQNKHPLREKRLLKNLLVECLSSQSSDIFVTASLQDNY